MSAGPAEVVIVGGGIIGTALAYDLTLRGLKPVIYDRRELAREASWASAGIISAPVPGTPTTELAGIAYRRYPSLVQEVEDMTGLATGWNPTGETILGTDARVSALRDLLAWYREHEIEAEWLDREQLREREPAVHEQFACGLSLAGVASILLGRFAVGLARAAVQQGAMVHEHEAVLEIETSGGRATGVRTINGSRPADMVIVAAGAWSRSLGDSLDFEIPTLPVRGQMMAIADPPLPVNSVMAYDRVYLVPRADGTVAVGATEEAEAGFHADVTPAGIRWLAERVAGIAPSLNEGRLVATWAGLRPGTAHGVPVIGPVPHLDNVWIATGHFRSGALLAPATSQLVAESIASGVVDRRLHLFLPGA